MLYFILVKAIFKTTDIPCTYIHCYNLGTTRSNFDYIQKKSSA